MLIFNANLWHGGSSKKNDKSRWALVLGYARWFVKPSFDYMKNTPIKIYNQLTSKQKSLLGFDLIPPKDEFTRMRRRSEFYEIPDKFILFVISFFTIFIVFVISKQKKLTFDFL